MGNKKRVKLIIAGALILILIFLGMYKLMPYMQEKEVERQELELEAMNKKQIAVNELVEEYLQSYTYEIQQQMRQAGIKDIQVVYSEYPKEEYASDFGVDEYEEGDYFYYIVLDYYSDSIDEIYNEKTKDGNYDELEEVVKALCLITNNIKEIHELNLDDATIKIHLQNKHFWNAIRIKKDGKHFYDFNQWGDDIEARIDGEVVYETRPKPVKKNSSTDKSYSSKKSTSKKSTSRYPDDPYDVYDYSDPEDFYYDNWDDFYEYEEAEDYYNEAWNEVE